MAKNGLKKWFAQKWVDKPTNVKTFTKRAKAAKGYAAGYIGKSIKGNYGGVELSNPSYVKYYGRKFMP
jgi:hypothetical protein